MVSVSAATSLSETLTPATKSKVVTVTSSSIMLSVSSTSVALAVMLAESTLVSISTLLVSVVMSAVKSRLLAEITVVASPSSITEPAERIVTFPVPAETEPTPVTSPTVVVREIFLFVPACTSVAVMAPAEVTVIIPLAVSKSDRAMASNSSIIIAPVPVTERSLLPAVVSRLMPVAASAVRTSAVTSSLSSVPS